LTDAFGEDILTTDGTLDRKRLGARIFADQGQRERLNHILHPFIIARQDEILNGWEAEDPNGIGIVDAALMIESGGYKRFDKLIVVWCRPELQLARLMDRRGLDENEAKKRIASQLPQDEKKRYADYLIDTSSAFDDTKRQTLELVAELRSITN
jgi:dephospho-CoA kinase